MKIYIDFIFIINFFFDFLLLYGTSKILKRILSLKRIILGSLTGTISLIFLFINLSSLELLMLKILLSTLMILVTFGSKNFIKNMIYFYTLSIILGGTLYLFDITITYENTGFIFTKNGYIINFIIILIISPIIIGLYIKEHLSYKIKISNKYQVEIAIKQILESLG
jgi:stage II sporulation protein GA (sporulation sigma-E factor processing peptidase)